MKNIGVFVSENFQLLEVKFSIYLNRSVFVTFVWCKIYIFAHKHIVDTHFKLF